MRRKILIGLGAVAMLLGVFAIVVALQPSTFRVTRSATMAASPQAVFDQINELRAWDNWSPWAKLDPNAKATFEGPAAGPSAIFRWSGNDKIGEGQMTVIESRAPEHVSINVEFVRPFQGNNITEFSLQPAGAQTSVPQTSVTWAMFGRQNFISKAMCLFVSMDKILGGDMEKGLAQMKVAAEAAAKK